ncbi:MAG: hypothetical protein A3I39_00515 [Candidatus Yanofskybacteria bacterium RIFCSPLOWO2_02_FULL_47_9b]|uniref:Galactose-1-phosphate uridyl transferase N-terminal domain-containing protein n=1 Tax=Candidatus Yanofskybacteria bacterium RIFCSPLOWO2_02_FULL_47_9b TaxID=1802708 RepID=A0A1F8H5P0_9BACT|nr:MAG: hypothetical protein A3I39_00515 [Candidatus Yanofskybacteria bacterium RIFCSPLOWO2_02_FULL_47_9b]
MTNQFRQDPLSGDWVLISPARAQRPENKEHIPFANHDCPFDDPQKTGQEKPVAIYAHGQKTDIPDGWTVQVLPNKYPAVLPGQCGPVMEQGLFSVAAGVGSHELVITRDHDRHFANFTDEEMAEVINIYRDRYIALSADPCTAYVMIFHNHGVLAGASIFHNHSQIISLPVIPPQLQRMFERSDVYLKKTGKRLGEELLAEELKNNRIVYKNQKFVAYCPFASRSPYEVRIIAVSPRSDFGALSDGDVLPLAEAMREVFGRLDKVLNDPDYTFYFHTAPPRATDGALDWHIEVMPRFSPAAGLEFSTGVFVNTVDPDEAANKLRSVTL